MCESSRVGAVEVNLHMKSCFFDPTYLVVKRKKRIQNLNLSTGAQSIEQKGQELPVSALSSPFVALI